MFILVETGDWQVSWHFQNKLYQIINQTPPPSCSPTHPIKECLWSASINHGSLTPTVIYVSQLKNKHVRCRQLPAQCCHDNLSIKVQLPLLPIELSAFLVLQIFVWQSISKHSRKRVCHLKYVLELALEVFLPFVWSLTLAMSPDKCRTLPREKEKLTVTQTGGMYSPFHTGSGTLTLDNKGDSCLRPCMD